MNKCKRNEEGHIFRLDVPHFYKKEDESVVEHYSNMIRHRLAQRDDPFWRNWTPEVFVHLQCQYCGAEEHIYMEMKYLSEVMWDPDFAMKWDTYKHLTMDINGDRVVDEIVKL